MLSTESLSPPRMALMWCCTAAGALSFRFRRILGIVILTVTTPDKTLAAR